MAITSVTGINTPELPFGVAVFLDPFAISLFDEEHSRDEERWVTLGKDNNEVLLVVVHTFKKIDSKSCTIRIISARKATKKERYHYEQ